MRSNKELIIKRKNKYRTNRYYVAKKAYITNRMRNTSQKFDVRVNRHYWNTLQFTPRFKMYIRSRQVYNRI